MSQIEKTSVFRCRSADRWDYANFVVHQRYDDAKPGYGYFMLAIESSFGNGYAYAWSDIGNDFYEFLARQEDDPYYVGGKFCSGDPNPVDWEASSRNLRKRICEMRRCGACTAEEAREAWPSIMDSEGEFWVWANEYDLVSDVHEELVTVPGPRKQQFLGLHKMFWSDFARLLRAARQEAA